MNRFAIRLLVLLCLPWVMISAVQAADVDEPAPEVLLPGLIDKAVVSLESYAGKIVYLDFWASWCPPCLVSMPIMNDLRNTLQEQGVDFEVLAVNVDSDPEDGIDFLLDGPVDFVVLSDPDGKTPALYGVKGMPTSYLIDQNGRIVMKHEGFKRSDVVMIENRIRELAGQGK